MTAKTLARGWRSDLEALVRSAERDLIIACPFIKASEADWLVGHVPPSASVSVLTNISTGPVQDEVLDIRGLEVLQGGSRSTVTTVPGLHAKVFIADDHLAIVTSANLTKAGLDTNAEYGVRLDDEGIVQQVGRDLSRYAALGSVIDPTSFPDLIRTGDDLVEERRRLERSASTEAQQAFREVVLRARQRFAAEQVGGRSANDLFGVAIKLALEDGPLRTAELAAVVQSLLPELCDDSEELIINGERYGKAWKHNLRNAQQHLKRRGEATNDPATRTWRLTQSP